jgi:nicotinamide-nucleotide amidase
VSESVASQMASHVRKIMKTDFGVAVTGIAGPSGGSPEKPVGTVWIAVAKEKNVVSRKFLFGTVRERNIERTILSALNMLRLELIEAIW